MNRTQLWGFEVSHIVASVMILAGSNITLNVFGLPLFLSWCFGITTLAVLRLLSHGQKNGHLELLLRFVIEPHLFLGHKRRLRKKEDGL